jgi:hypothetical protein
MQHDCGNAADQKTVRITRQYDMTKPIITPAADYSLVGCNKLAHNRKCTLTDNCGVGELNLEI